MCTPAVGLVAAAFEAEGISTVAIQLLRFVAEKVRPPRGLYVPFPHGYPLDAPCEPERQHAVLEACLGLLEDPAPRGPLLHDFTPVHPPVDHAPSPYGELAR